MSPITVMEVWRLKDGLQDQALELMQAMDDMLGPGAHAHPGWCGHAQFFQSVGAPTEVVMLYPWRSRELHQDLLRREDGTLEAFYAAYCREPRQIAYYGELAVDTEDRDHAIHAAAGGQS
jgi:3-oxoacyl-[acyl-carrier protein] reductase